MINVNKAGILMLVVIIIMFVTITTWFVLQPQSGLLLDILLFTASISSFVGVATMFYILYHEWARYFKEKTE